MAHHTKESFLALTGDQIWNLFSKSQSECGSFKELNTKMDILISKINKLEDEIEVGRRVNKALKVEIVNMRRKINKDSQYQRQENLEFSGIPEHIPDSDLENTALKLLKKTGVVLKSSDVVDCHRLKNPKKVIIRLVNRKHCQLALHGSKKLRGNTSDILGDSIVYLNRNLIPEFNTLRWKAKKMKVANYIYNFGTNRRGIWVQSEADGEKKQVEIEDDLLVYLPEGILLSDV